MTKLGNTYTMRGLKPLERVTSEPIRCKSCLGLFDWTSQTVSTKFRFTTYRCRGCGRRLQWRRPK